MTDSKKNHGSPMAIQSKTGEFTPLEDREIPPFVELASKYGKIDVETAQKIKNYLKNTVAGLDIHEPTSVNNLKGHYEVIYSKIKEGIFNSNKNKKNLLIGIGEDHGERKSLLLTLMIMQVAKRFGIQSFLTETSQKLLEEIKKMRCDEFISPNFSFALKFSKKLDFKIICCDLDTDIYGDNFNSEMRFKSIDESIIKINEHALFIMGVCHLRHICENKQINDKFDVLCFETENSSDLQRISMLDFFKSQNESGAFNDFYFAYCSKKIIHLEIKSNPYALDYKDKKKLLKELDVKFKQENPFTAEELKEPKGIVSCTQVDEVTNNPDATPFQPVSIQVRYNTGMDHAIYLRGEGSPELNWDKGILMQNREADLWTIELKETASSGVKFKLLLDDCRWESSSNREIKQGENCEITPFF